MALGEGSWLITLGISSNDLKVCFHFIHFSNLHSVLYQLWEEKLRRSVWGRDRGEVMGQGLGGEEEQETAFGEVKGKKIEEIVMMSIIYSKESQGQYLNNHVIKGSSLLECLLYSCEK